MRTSIHALVCAASLTTPPCTLAQAPETYAIDPSRGIDERTYLDIDGVAEYVIIRGEDRHNPVLLFVHGGPGAAASLYAWKYFTRGGWEKNFTVVHWDQPGAAKTFEKAGKRLDPDLTVDRIVDDGIAVSETVARRLGKNKIVLVGGSWGTLVGVKMAKKRPDLFAAYVAAGQIVNKPEDEAVGYRQVLDKARARSNAAAVAELEKSGPPPYATNAAFIAQRKWASAFERMPAIDARKEVETTPGTVPADLQLWYQGFLASDAHFRGTDMKGIAATVDLRAFGPMFAVPVFFIQGTDDDITPMSQVASYYEWIEAPSKRLIALEGAGHNAVISRAAEFARLLDTHVRPLSIEPAQ